MQPDAFDFERLLIALAEGNVEFILVGGMCAVLHGAPLVTLDVDIVPNRTADNLQRLEAVLRSLGAYYREHPPGKIVPAVAFSGIRIFGPSSGAVETSKADPSFVGMT